MKSQSPSIASVPPVSEVGQRRPSVPVVASVALAALSAAVVWDYRESFRWILIGWNENPYYSHGPLVPVITVFLIWRLRAALATTCWRTWWPGLTVVAGAACMFVLGRAFDINFIAALSPVVLIHGLVLTVGGPAVYRLTVIPLGFLVFAIPVSWLLIHEHSFPLQLFSARSGAGLLHLLTGADAYAAGSVVNLDQEEYVIGVQCSGFKAVLGLTLVGIVTAYLTDTTVGKKLLICLMAEPIAVSTFHDLSGIIMLVVAVLLLLAVARLVVGPEADVAGAPAPEGDGRVRLRLGWQPLAASTVLLLIGANVGFALMPPQPEAPDVDLDRIPLTIGRWRGQEGQVDPRVYQVLGEVGAIQRPYTEAPQRRPIDLIVICGRGRRSLHNPAACYRGAGNEVLGQDNVDIPFGDETLRFQRLIIGSNGQPMLVAFISYTDGQITTTDWTKEQQYSFRHKEVVWTQLHFASPWIGNVEETQRRTIPLIQASWPRIRAVLPKTGRP